jgi:hypothetical protein
MLQLAQGTRRAAFGGRHAVVRKVRARAEGKAPEQSTGSVEEKGAAGDEKPAEERKPEPDAAGNVYIDELPVRICLMLRETLKHHAKMMLWPDVATH